MEGKQKRKLNWIFDELLVLVLFVDDYKYILWGKFSFFLIFDMKIRVWGEVLQKLCVMGVGFSRIFVEVEKKWYNIFLNFKSEILSYRRIVFGIGQLVIVLYSVINLIGYIKFIVDLMYVLNFFFFLLSFINNSIYLLIYFN